MNKKLILISVMFLFSLLLMSFVSAGLCRGSDGYYHDCDDFSDRYYKRNFYPNYKIEYYKETSESKSSIESIKEDRYSYEKISASSSAETSIESYKKQRDYSYPKKKYYRDKYSYYGRDYGRYEYNEPQLVMFVNKIKPVHYINQAKYNNKKGDADWKYKYSPSSSWSDWRNAKPYRWREYDSDNYNDYYYKPRYNDDKQEYNWGW